MFLLLLLAVLAIVGIVFSIRSVVTDRPQPVPTHYSQLIR
jgi:hypothetical protein